MKSMLDYFKLGLAIGDKVRGDLSDVPDSLLKIERPSEAMQFVIAGVMVGYRIEDPWAILEKLEVGDDTGAA